MHLKLHNHRKPPPLSHTGPSLMGNLINSRSCIIRIAIPQTVENAPKRGARPTHHANNEATEFVNPWPSYKEIGFAAICKVVYQFTFPSVPKNIGDLIPVHVPTWVTSDADTDKIKATWLGHACFLLELPSPTGATRGPRVILDPVLTPRCSPVKFVGPKRFTAAPCAIDELPDIDLVLVSHNHYDHMDTTTLRTINDLQHPHYFSTLGNQSYFSSLSIPKERTHILDWWQTRIITLALPKMNGKANETIETSFELTCTPAQHHTSRGLFDQSKTLWAGFVLSSLPELSDKEFTVYFTGDTGYRYVPDGSNERDAPVCPIFKELGDKFGGFDLALLPIGAYLPREYMSSIHASPSDSVQIFKDIRARRAIAMHWGTWLLGSSEPVMEPPQRLEEACAEEDIKAGTFTTAPLGRTIAIECELRHHIISSGSSTSS